MTTLLDELNLKVQLLRRSVLTKESECDLMDNTIKRLEDDLAIEKNRLEQLSREYVAHEEADDALLAHLKHISSQSEILRTRLLSVEGEYNAAQNILLQMEAMRKAAENNFNSTVADLKKRFAIAADALAGYRVPQVVRRADALQNVIGEQDYELSILRETLAAAAAASLSATLAKPTILSTPSRIVLPTASCDIPVPLGRMRRLTGASGNGLQALRHHYLIGCRSVEDDTGNVKVCLWGHANGVRACAAEIEQILA